MAGVGPDASGLPLGLYGFGASATLALQVARHWDAEVYVVTRSEAEARRALDPGAVWAGTYDEPVPVPLGAAVTFAPAGAVVAGLCATATAAQQSPSMRSTWTSFPGWTTTTCGGSARCAPWRT